MSEIVIRKVSQVEKKMYKCADQSLIIAMGNETIELLLAQIFYIQSARFILTRYLLSLL